METLKRTYFDSSIATFLETSEDEILGFLTKYHEFDLEEQQRNAWIHQISILKKALKGISGHLFFEYSIPRMGNRIDCVLIIEALVFAIEFKIGAKKYDNHAIDQVLDYALDLKNFHEQSHNQVIVPILLSSEAPIIDFETFFYDDNIIHPIKANTHSLADIISDLSSNITGERIDPIVWANSIYKPTPTIIEAAQALYQGHDVKEISRSDSGAINLSNTSNAILSIANDSKRNGWKSICFLTGVPGAGKTLAGLNIANSWQKTDESEHAVFLSGNGPLVTVLREALVRNDVQAAKDIGIKLKKSEAISKVEPFIQNIHHFRDDCLSDKRPPIEKIVVFDEAQRAWSQKKTAAFMKEKKNIIDFDMSEPEFLIGVMDRHESWATIICLIGGGQEINTGEAGLHEWFDALRHCFPDWHIYVSSGLDDHEYTRGKDLYKSGEFKHLSVNEDLHLSVSVRSFRSEKVAELVKAILDHDIQSAVELYSSIKTSYPFVITRNINKAKRWLRSKTRGSERTGIIASSGGLRLKPFGLNTKVKIDPRNWFLNVSSDIRSSNFLEDIATEFDIQGLELDWTCVAWDADLRYDPTGWLYKSFKGTKWQNIKDSEKKIYLVNAYRVLLTRARQGMVIFIPHGSDEDITRKHEYYDSTFDYLKSLGINVI